MPDSADTVPVSAEGLLWQATSPAIIRPASPVASKQNFFHDDYLGE
jgi:hypothetical protein